MRTLLALLLFGLVGCNTTVGLAPSMDNCEKVSYLREGTDVTIYLKCTAPYMGVVR